VKRLYKYDENIISWIKTSLNSLMVDWLIKLIIYIISVCYDL
jgi:hypothetical protein